LLVFETRLVEADGIVEFREEAARILHEVNRRTLMGREAAAVHLEVVLLGLTAEDRMIFQYQDAGLRTGLPSKKKRCSQPADAAAYDNAVIAFAGVADGRRVRRILCVAEAMAGGEDSPGIAVTFGVFADSAVAVPILGGAGQRISRPMCEKLRGRKRLEQLGPRSEQGGAKEIPARDGVVHTERQVAGLVRFAGHKPHRYCLVSSGRRLLSKNSFCRRRLLSSALMARMASAMVETQRFMSASPSSLLAIAPSPE